MRLDHAKLGIAARSSPFLFPSTQNYSGYLGNEIHVSLNSLFIPLEASEIGSKYILSRATVTIEIAQLPDAVPHAILAPNTVVGLNFKC